MIRYITLSFLLILSPWIAESKLPELNSEIVVEKINEILQSHASQEKLTPVIVKRALQNYLDELDPNKTYFVTGDINQLLEPTDQSLNDMVVQFQNGNFKVFFDIQDKMAKSIERRHNIDKQIDYENLPKKVNPSEFKDMEWVENEDELLARLMRIRALQIETTSKLNGDLKEKTQQRIQKHQEKTEEQLLESDPGKREKIVLARVMKAVAGSLDTHTAYFTPEEATQFMINVQQRLFGIGAQLRDDLNGFTIIKIIEGGPAAQNKDLKLKDRIVAVDGEPVVGMDIINAVELIRGQENTPVTLTVIREVGEEDDKTEEKHEINIMRGEVVLKETRYESSFEPYGDGVIAYLKLFSFYQDPEYSSATDLEGEIKKLKKDHNVLGVILDLRFNSGGMLSQAVAVTGLFITKGVVVSIKDNHGNVQHLRDLDGSTAWDGPLIVLVNRASASASEIVAQTLQDYGRALIVGDDHTYGKGSFQTFSLNSTKEGQVNPQGEFKVTRGRYYTVSGKTPQLKGVQSDIVLPGPLSELDIGEQYAKYPLENDSIAANFDDDLADIPYLQRQKVRMLYQYDLQQKIEAYTAHLENLKKNSNYRLENNNNYQSFLKELKKKDPIEQEEESEQFGQNDLQLTEANNIMKDLVLMMKAN